MWSNGWSDSFVYDVGINTAASDRNIKVKVPITELANDNRVAILNIKAGNVEVNDIVYAYNKGNSFFLGEYDLLNVPGDIDNVKISIYLPTY